jgi:sulfur carrier protein ThiS
VKVKVRLFGTLGQKLSGYRHSQEIEVEIPEMATSKDLLDNLGLSDSQGLIIIAEGKVLQADDLIREGIVINVMQAIRGGGHIQA